MKKEIVRRKAEEILTGDSLSELAREFEQNQELTKDQEYQMASKIYEAVNEKKQLLGNEQKELLGNKIIRTIKAYKRRKLVIGISSAAVLILTIGITLFFELNVMSDLEKFAKNSQSVEFNGSTRLILSGKEEIKINTNESKIAYTDNGEEIKIDSKHEVKQAVGGDKLVMNTLVVPYGKRAHITLSDSSKVWINSGSKLIYPAKFSENKREVYLEGEAMFEVSHNKKRPFLVLTSNVNVKVLGTVFNVSAYRDDKTVNTVLESGSVELKYNSQSIWGHSKVLMIPGMLAEYDSSNGTVEQSKVNTKYYTSWRDGYFEFKKETLGTILKKISRYYNVSIKPTNPEWAGETYSGQLDLRNSVDQVLEIISEIIGANTETIDNQIFLTRK